MTAGDAFALALRNDWTPDQAQALVEGATAGTRALTKASVVGGCGSAAFALYGVLRGRDWLIVAGLVGLGASFLLGRYAGKAGITG